MPYGNEQVVVVTTRKGPSRLDVRVARLVFKTRERALRVVLGLARGESVSPDEDAA